MSALTDAFTAIANAIRNKKGVSTKYTPAQMPNAIASIETGTDTSDATLDSGSRMLSGYTAYAQGTKYTGSMPNRGAVSQTINPGGSYTIPAGYHDGSGTVRANNASLQNKTTTVTPSANWSGTNTNNATINPDSGYDGMSQVNVNVPMLRDNTLMTADTVDIPGTVYNGNTAQSNSQKLLRMHPTKDGMSYTGSYLYMKPNSYLGDAGASDVKSGKKFSSSNGIQLIGTWEDYMIVKKNVEVENTRAYATGTGGGSRNATSKTVTYNGKTLTYIGALDPIISFDNTIDGGGITQDNFVKNFNIWIRIRVTSSEVIVYRETSNSTGTTLNNVKIVVPLLFADIPTIS